MAAIPPDRRPAEPTPLHPPLSPPVCFTVPSEQGPAPRRGGPGTDRRSARARMRGTRKRASGGGGRGGCAAAAPASAPGLVSGPHPKTSVPKFRPGADKGRRMLPEGFLPRTGGSAAARPESVRGVAVIRPLLVAARMVARFCRTCKNQRKYSCKFLCINISRVHIRSTSYPQFSPLRLHIHCDHCVFSQAAGARRKATRGFGIAAPAARARAGTRAEWPHRPCGFIDLNISRR